MSSFQPLADPGHMGCHAPWDVSHPRCPTASRAVGTAGRRRWGSPAVGSDGRWSRDVEKFSPKWHLRKNPGFFSKGCLHKHWIWFWAFFGMFNIRGMDIHKLVGGFNLPLWKMMEWKSVVHLIPNTWSHKIHVPNHQPVMVMYINPY